MASSVFSYLHGGLTLMEGVLNVMSYLPKQEFPNLHKQSVHFRRRYGKIQMISGIAVWALGFFIELLKKDTLRTKRTKPFTLEQKVMEFGLLHANHGVLNIGRSYMQEWNLGFITVAYDFYGRKWMPALSPNCDIQSIVFEAIKNQLDRICFITLFPPRLVITI